MNEKKTGGAGMGTGKYLLFVFFLLLLLTCEKPERILKFETLEVVSTDISSAAATVKGEVTDLGSKPIEQHGLLLSESSVPALGQQNTVEKPLGVLKSKKVFSADFTGLKANTPYYFRAYVVVDGTPELGSIMNFTTKDSEAPAVTAGTVSEITMTTASLGGEVTSDGGEPATVRGICWGTSASPTIATALDTTVNGTGSGTFTGRMTGLTAGTTYYARTYAKNTKGTVYNSADGVFKTHSLPVVTTTAISSITTSGASSGGEVTDDGGVTVSARGVCWGTTTGPTIALTTKTTDGTGEGIFTSTISGLSSGTTYYVRAYATNQYGTTYGPELSFTAGSTLLPPSATTSPATPVGATTATLNGSVNANGLSTTVTFEYGTTTTYGQTATAAQSPVTGNSATSVSVSIGGLLPSTTYHFRVKAVSTGGTSYGGDDTFTTTATLPTVTDYDGNIYDIITIGTQQWLQSNLMTEHYSNGEAIPEVTDQATWSTLVTGALGWYNDDKPVYKSEYGGYYNWFTITDIRNLCPAGWHVPSDDEWNTLINYLGGNDIAGGKLKETGTAHWSDPNTDATNSSGFTALPSGYRSYGGGYGYMGLYGYWWSSTEGLSSDASYWYVSVGDGTILLTYGGWNYGFPVRCLKGAIPFAVSSAAGSVASSSATLKGRVNPNGASTTVTFEYGKTLSYGSIVTASQSPVSVAAPADMSANLTSLTPNTTYHFRIKAINTDGEVYGDDMTFVTPYNPPSATTGTATGVGPSDATLNGTVNANFGETTVVFEYGTTTAYGSEVTASQSPVSGGTATSVSASVAGLSPLTLYHYRVKATNSGGTTYGNDGSFTTTAALPTVADYDGNLYNIITIGTQEWMQKNLMVTHFSNGEAIPNVTDNATWGGLTTAAYSWYNNDAATYKNTYGALYNWYVASDIRNACPVGWHVPTDAEWTTLSTYLGGEAVSGGKLKEAGLTHWITPNTGATNETGFTALPAGERESDGNNFSAIGYSNFLWSQTSWDASYSWARFIPHNQEYLFRQYYQNKYGYSIRCLEGAIPLSQTDSATAVASTSVTLNGRVNPNGLSTTVTIEYGTSTAYGSSITPAQSPASETEPVDISAGLTSLTAGITYHYRIKVVNSAGTSYGSNMVFVTPDKVADVDGNVYDAVIIGPQTWMQQNLKTRKFNDNTNIPEVTNSTTWSGLSTPAYCWYNNDKSTYGDVYGALYNWYAVNTGKLCPTGWHMPTDAEWTTLTDFIGGESVAGGKLKETGTTHWTSPNTASTNETGFTAFPGGYRYNNGINFYFIGIYGYWWSSSETSATSAYLRNLYYDSGSVLRFSDDKRSGSSIRCLKD